MGSSLIRRTPLQSRAAARTIGGIVLALATLSGQGCGGADPVTALGPDEAQTIAGRVTAEDGTPVPGADVTLEPLGVTASTDDAGRFAFTVPPSISGVSQYLLEVRSDGYEAVSLHVVVSRSGTADLIITLDAIPSEVEPEPVPEPDPDSAIVVTSYSTDEVLCIASGVELSYTVWITNEGDAPVDGIVLHDTLDTGFRRILSDSDIVVDRVHFPDAAVVLNPDGRSFRVEIGTVAPMESTEVYTVALPASDGGVFCNRVSALGKFGALLSGDISCLTNTLALRIHMLNEDGAIVSGLFSPEPEAFHVGDGGPDRPDALVFRVVVANHNCGSLGFPMGQTSLTSMVPSGILEFRDVLAGFPTHGSIASSGTDGFVWSIGTLAPGGEAEIRFRAEAIQAGEDLHRIELAVPQLTGTLVHEEPITILP